jgi:hypothetical protein
MVFWYSLPSFFACCISAILRKLKGKASTISPGGVQKIGEEWSLGRRMSENADLAQAAAFAANLKSLIVIFEFNAAVYYL